MGPLTFITDCRANKWIGRKYIAIVDIPSNENLLERRSIYSLVRKERSRNNNVRHIVIKKSRNEIKATNRKEQFLLFWTHAWSCESKMRISQIHRNFNTQVRPTAGKIRTIKVQILRFGHSHSQNRIHPTHILHRLDMISKYTIFLLVSLSFEWMKRLGWKLRIVWSTVNYYQDESRGHVRILQQPSCQFSLGVPVQ